MECNEVHPFHPSQKQSKQTYHITKLPYSIFLYDNPDEGSTRFVYWLPDPMETVREEAKRLNMMLMDPQKRLHQIRTDKIGGILVVTQIVTSSGTGIPFLTVLAAPSGVTVNFQTGDDGILLEDVCDATVLSAFQPDLVTSDIHCPLIGAQEGFSRLMKLDPKIFSFLQGAQPLFLPEGGLTCTDTSICLC
jgi:hypothetical protein